MVGIRIPHGVRDDKRQGSTSLRLAGLPSARCTRSRASASTDGGISRSASAPPITVLPLVGQTGQRYHCNNLCLILAQIVCAVVVVRSRGARSVEPADRRERTEQSSASSTPWRAKMPLSTCSFERGVWLISIAEAYGCMSWTDGRAFRHRPRQSIRQCG